MEDLQLGHYRLMRLIGQGDMGGVYLAEDTRISRQVAIKIIRSDPESQASQQAERLFQREIQAIAQLNHPHILSVYDFGKQPDTNGSTIYMVMPYCAEGSLKDWLVQHGPALLAPQDVGQMIMQAASALQYAHDRGIIHHDVKPANFLVRANADHPTYPDLLLTDFGIAKITSTTSTISQSIRGTYAYMAPEQWCSDVVATTDQYALAMMAYQLLTGQLPFQGRSEQMMFQHLTATPETPSHINTSLSPAIDQVILCALAKKADERFSTITAFATALQQALDDALQRGNRTHVFISYARRDQNLRDQLENHLSNLKYRGLITTWTAGEISAGEETIQQIDVHLNTAHLILLLISTNFLASNYCYSREMIQAIQRHERGEADVIPVLLRPVVFTGAPFAKLQPLPTNGKPVASWRNRDSAFVDIALGIERVVQKCRASQEIPLPLESSVVRSSYPISAEWATMSPFPSASPYVQSTRATSPRELISRRSRRGSLLAALSLLGLVSAGLLLVQHPNLIPLVGVTVGGLILLAGIFLAIRALVKRAQSKTAQKREQEEIRRRELKAARRREQEETRRRELEEVQRRERERAYYEKALTAYEQALRKNNADVMAYRGKGNALVGLECYGEALTAFEQAAVLMPLPVIYVSMGDVFATLGRHDEAVAAYEQALALDASCASAYTGMSKALLQLGRTQEAEQSYQQAKALGDEDWFTA